MTIKTLVQFSGGIESTVLLYQAMYLYGKENTFVLAFDEGDLHREMVAIREILTKCGMRQQTYFMRSPSWVDMEAPRDADFPDFGFVPGMKMLMNTLALSWAQVVGAQQVLIGNMRDNVYPDERQDWIDEYVATYNKIYEADIAIVAPFQDMTKSEVLQLGQKLRVPWEDTVSCGNEKMVDGYNCGICDWCVKRRQAFKEAGIEDPSVYTLLHLEGQ